jgi:hypothetical protein
VNEPAAAIGQLGPVEICIPPDPRLARVVRLAASAVAAQIGFDVDLIDDVKLVVSEILLALVEMGEGDRITLTFTAEEAQFAAYGTTVARSFDPADSRISLSLQVLEGVASHHQFAFADGQIHLSAVVRDIVV